MLKNIWNDIILLNLKDYENIGVDFYINIFFFVLAVFICISFFVIEHKRGCMRLTVKQLMRHNAEGEESAKTLFELGISSRSIKRALSTDTRLSKIVKRVGAHEYTYEEYVKLSKEKKLKKEKIDFTTARFYINKSYEQQAKHIYENYNTSLVKSLLMCALVILIYGAVAAVSSEIIEYINSALGA